MMILKYKVELNMNINDILTKKLDISTRLKNKLIKNKHIFNNYALYYYYSNFINLLWWQFI